MADSKNKTADPIEAAANAAFAEPAETVETTVPALPPELASRFVTETDAVTGDQASIIRQNAYAVATAAEQIAMLPASRERSLALTALEEALMWANKAVFSA